MCICAYAIESFLLLLITIVTDLVTVETRCKEGCEAQFCHALVMMIGSGFRSSSCVFKFVAMGYM